MFTTPKTILNVIASLEINNDTDGLSSLGGRISYAVCNVLFTVNYSSNFYFYCCANQEIKSAALTLLSGWRDRVTSFYRRKVNILNVLIW